MTRDYVISEYKKRIKRIQDIEAFHLATFVGQKELGTAKIALSGIIQEAANEGISKQELGLKD